MTRNRFKPERVTIRVGETVEWRNTSGISRTVTADPEQADDPGHVVLPEGAEKFDSGKLRPSKMFRHQFPVPGTYKYICVPHESAGMLGCTG
jgi:plastocyanin